MTNLLSHKRRFLGRTLSVGPEVFRAPMGRDVEVRGIPHLAKNEQGVWHPGFIALQKLELQLRLASWSPLHVTHWMVVVVGKENQPLLGDRPA